MNTEILQNLGLTKNESKLYCALVKLKSASVNELSRESDVSRVNCYDVLESLKAKGLVGTITKTNKMFYEPADPKVLEEFAVQKKEALSETDDTIDHLKSVFASGTAPQDVRVFKGKLGIRTVLKGALNSKTEILNFGSGGMFPSYYPEYFDIWESLRAKAKVSMRIVASKNVDAPKKRLQKVRFLDFDFKNMTSTFIYEDYVAIFIWTEKPLAILIQDSAYAESNQNYFEYLWDKAEIV